MTMKKSENWVIYSKESEISEWCPSLLTQLTQLSWKTYNPSPQTYKESVV